MMNDILMFGIGMLIASLGLLVTVRLIGFEGILNLFFKPNPPEDFAADFDYVPSGRSVEIWVDGEKTEASLSRKLRKDGSVDQHYGLLMIEGIDDIKPGSMIVVQDVGRVEPRGFTRKKLFVLRIHKASDDDQHAKE